MSSWTEEELRTAHFHDKRLDRRFRLLVDRLSCTPALKFNAACRGRAEVKAAYRFVNHPNYLVISAEILVLPLAIGEWWVAGVFTVLNAAVLAWRIHQENAALALRRASGAQAAKG